MGSKGSLGRRVGWLVAAVGPPSVVAGTSLGWVEGHPVAAIGLGLAYEAVLGVVGFAGDVAGGLRGRWRDRLVDRVDEGLLRRLSHFGGRYREYLLSSLRFIDLKGLATIGYHTPELDEVFVDVSLALRAPHQVPGDPLADLPAGVTERASIWEFLDRSGPVVLAVIGAPGAARPRCCGIRRGGCASGGGGAKKSRCCSTCATTSPPLCPRRRRDLPRLSAALSGGTRRRSPRAGSSSA